MNKPEPPTNEPSSQESSDHDLEARERELVERQALRTVELVALAAKLKPRQNVCDDDEAEEK